MAPFNLESAGVDLKKIEKCMGDLEADEDNPVLKEEQEAQVSEAMDLRIRQSLTRHTSRTSCVQNDVMHIVLDLLKSISRSSFPNEKSYALWKNRQANILEELCCLGHLTTEHATVKHSIGKIRNAREWDIMSPTEQSEILSSIKVSASNMSQKQGIGEQNADLLSGHHLKIRLYEKLLSSMFDILEEGQIIAEANEILKLIQLTWSTLGINQIIHDALYCWVLFNQKFQIYKAYGSPDHLPSAHTCFNQWIYLSILRRNVCRRGGYRSQSMKQVRDLDLVKNQNSWLGSC